MIDSLTGVLDTGMHKPSILQVNCIKHCSVGQEVPRAMRLRMALAAKQGEILRVSRCEVLSTCRNYPCFATNAGTETYAR